VPYSAASLITTVKIFTVEAIEKNDGFEAS
jgi:hypothetical protein